MMSIEGKLSRCVVALNLDFLSRVRGCGYVRNFCIPSNRFNDFNNNKFSLAMYHIHTMG